MLGSPDAYTLMMMALVFGFAGFFGGVAMNGVLEDDGFGVVGNMLILIAGAIIGLQFGGIVRLPFESTIADAVRAVAGGFVCLTALALTKNLLARFGL